MASDASIQQGTARQTHGKRVEALLQDVPFEVAGAAGVDAPGMTVDGIAFRSDAVQPGDLFFCVPGFKADGHDFAADAVARGAQALVVQRELPLAVPQFLVDDARAALALASSRFFDVPSQALSLVGVTGTNGKTTTTFLVDWVARSLGEATGVIGTVETRIGKKRIHADHTTPESMTLQQLLAQMRDAGLGLATMEVSSHAIDLKRVLGTRFRVVAFSNLTQDHLDYHKTMEAYFQAKAALFDPVYCQRAVICIDDAYGQRLADTARERGLDVLTTGFSQHADVRVADVGYLPTHTSIVLELGQRAGGGRHQLEFPLIGRFNVENVLLACGICLQLGYAPADIVAALQHAPQVPGRLERVSAAGLDARQVHEALGYSVFVDYAHTPDAIDNAIGALRPITRGRLVIVFGCGGDRDATKRPKMGAAACKADYVIVTSDNPRSEDPLKIIDDIVPGMRQGRGRYEVQPDRRHAIEAAIAMAQPGDSVLIAGKGHEDYQIVGDQVLDFDDRLVAAQALAAVLEAHR